MRDLSGTVLDRRYRVSALIGEGAMGCVFLAHDIRRSGATCALKMLMPHLTHDPKFGRRFTDEAKSLARLDHPNIVKMHEFFRVGDDYFIALDYVDGISLRGLIDRDKALPEALALPIFKAILSALDHGHQRGIIHRDVKPSNILIDKSGVPQLCDFGIAKQVAERGVTMTGMTIGTPEYMSPEQIQAPHLLDHRTDVYSAGIVLFEMLTGRVPFIADTTDSGYKVWRHHVESPLPDPRSINPSISEALAYIVAKSLRKDPRSRFQGCAAFLEAIEKYEATQVHPPVVRPPAQGALPSSDEGGGRRYRAYEHPTLGMAAVKQGLSCPALFANIVWMFATKLYVQAALWAAAYLALMVIASALPDVITLGVLLVLWVLPAYRGNAWREAELRRRGFKPRGTVSASSEDAALTQTARAHSR